jgi:hypothetical protein
MLEGFRGFKKKSSYDSGKISAKITFICSENQPPLSRVNNDWFPIVWSHRNLLNFTLATAAFALLLPLSRTLFPSLFPTRGDRDPIPSAIGNAVPTRMRAGIVQGNSAGGSS